MTVLRSREIVPRMELQTPAKNNDIVGVFEPGTPAKNLEGLNHQSATSPPTLSPKAPAQGAVGLGSGYFLRRSVRLASKLDSGLIEGGVGVEGSIKNIGRKRKRSDADALGCGFNLGTSVTGNGDLQMGRSYDKVPDKVNTEVGVFGGMSKVRVDITIVKPKESELHADSRNLDSGDGAFESGINGNRKREFGVKAELSGLVPVGQDQGQKEHKILYLRSGKKIVTNGVNPSNVDASQRVKSIGGDSFFSGNESMDIANGCSENGGVMNESKASAKVAENGNTNKGKKLNAKGKAQAKAKGKLVEKDTFTSSTDMVKLKSDAKEADGDTTGRVLCVDTRNPRRKEKGKEKVVENGFTSNSIDAVNCKSLNDAGKRNENRASGGSSFSDATSSQNAEQMNTSVNARERFRDIARRNASRFAHFSAQEDEDNHYNDVPCTEIPPSENEVEDWPGPFSTAMKIIKDRQKLSLQQQNTFVDKRGVAPVLWVPRKDRKGSFSKQSVPSLQDICLRILVKHADAITSLNCVPDVLRHKLSHLLSDSRRMNSDFLGLILEGSPTEIRVRDCSWLSEEIFTRTFEGCDIHNLTVLQLDQCGRCLSDYIVLDTLACSSNSLPALTTISFRAAYRLSDVGLSALVSSAPSLRSVDLSQCSLLTSDGICCLAASLGSVLRELYLDDCQGIDAMLILPALLNLQNLEVLSLSGSETVCDDFVCKFISVRGHTIKELGLADCTRLTDTSMRVIAETCPELRAINISNLCKLTDTALGYLANGCRAIQTLKMCRNSFSDEAVAAYLETCGDSLTELSLNNVGQVAQSTAISLSRHSKNLSYLDVCWCRNLTDEALGLIVDNCASLKVLKVFGCTQITDVFLLGHSNQEVQIVGLKMKPILEHLKEPDTSHGLLRYSSV